MRVGQERYKAKKVKEPKKKKRERKGNIRRLLSLGGAGEVSSALCLLLSRWGKARDGKARKNHVASILEFQKTARIWLACEIHKGGGVDKTQNAWKTPSLSPSCGGAVIKQESTTLSGGGDVGRGKTWPTDLRRRWENTKGKPGLSPLSIVTPGRNSSFGWVGTKMGHSAGGRVP